MNITFQKKTSKDLEKRNIGSVMKSEVRKPEMMTLTINFKQAIAPKFNYKLEKPAAMSSK